MKHLLLAAVVIPLLAACSDFDMQCDEFDQTEDQLACLDTGFQALRADQESCWGEREREREREPCDDGDELERGGAIFVCVDGGWVCQDDTWFEWEDDVYTCADGLWYDEAGELAFQGDRERDDVCEGEREAGERCRDRGDLDLLHADTRRDVTDSPDEDERRGMIRRGFRRGRTLANCDRPRGPRGGERSERGER